MVTCPIYVPWLPMSCIGIHLDQGFTVSERRHYLFVQIGADVLLFSFERVVLYPARNFS